MKSLRTIVDRFGVKFIERFGGFINPFLLEFKKENKQLLVFYFHGVFESSKQKDLNHIDPQDNMTTQQFAEFIDYFQNHNYKFIVPEDLNSDLEDGPYAMITFDDGYFNNMLAVDILNKYKVPAVIFISTKNITENKSYWWDIIYKYRTRQGVSMEKIRDEQSSLKEFKHDVIDDYILKKFGKEAFVPWSDIDRPFNIEEIKNLASNPYISIGNHTHNHAILVNYNKDEIKEELSLSNKIISELTNSKPISIAFPN
ncbi:MAG TPA: polysaccharide deacetylase family protein, partial [Hanamia sp.]